MSQKTPPSDIDANEDNYDRLIVTIEASQGMLALLIASCDDQTFRDRIIQRYQTELAPTIPNYHVKLNRAEPSLRAALAQLVTHHPQLQPTTPAAITVTGTENLLTVTLEDNTTQTEVEQFFGYLQWTREGLREFPYPIILWVTPEILKQISFAAPDFWSWRSGVFQFVATEKVITLSSQATSTFQTYDFHSSVKIAESLPLDELLQTLQQIETQQGENTPALAIVYDRIGQAYSSRVETRQTENLEAETNLAVEYFNKAIDLQTALGDQFNLASTLNRLANFYKNTGQYQQAISYHEKSLAVSREIGDQQGEAASWVNLGNCYRENPKGDIAQNIETAIKYYQNALQVYTRNSFPVDWATTQNNLANAYRNRIRGDRAENIENAIASYQNALQVYTRNSFPADWAATQNNLGEAYRNRIQGERAENIETAIKYYQNALQVYTRNSFPVEWAMTQNNLANAYRDRIIGEKADNLENAIASYQNALQVRTRNSFPQKWAMTQNNLANAYLYRIKGEKADNLENAIASYQNALQVYTRNSFPTEWATTQNNLAAAYSDRIKGEKADNLENAIASYQKALQVYTRNSFPQNYTETSFNLGLAYRDAQQWQQAYDAFSNAIDTVESLREEILSGDESKQKLAEEWNKLYRNMVETCLQLNQPKEALEYAERSKTRNLVEQILLRDSDQIFPPEVAAKLAKLRHEINSGQSQIQQGTVKDYPELAQYLQDLRQQRNALQNQYLPVGLGFDFDCFRQTLDDDTAVIEWYIGSETFFAFVILPSIPPLVEGGLGGIKQETIKIWQSTPEDFDRLIDWTKTYLNTYYNDPETWRNLLSDGLQTDDLEDGRKRCAPTLQNLADILHLDKLLEYLPATCQQLILIPHRFLHLFPLHALPVDQFYTEEGRKHCTPTVESRYLLDIFPKGVRFAPSCQLLQQLQTRQRKDFNNLFAIQNPTPDLYEKYEKDLGAVEAITEQFTTTQVLRHNKASKSALLPPSEKLQSANCLFFFCHGYFNLNSPLDSGLLLADDDLTVADIIADFHLENCRLVTLSACETGIPDFNNISDEYISLPYGFLLAGSTNVVSSLWKVEATTTALLMIKFYQELQQQDNITLALQTAQFWLRNTTIVGFQTWLSQLKLLREGKVRLEEYFNNLKQEMDATAKPFNSPYYWAAFCTIGKGE
ncbi:MAG: CHAT domain-containing tetratricopeptide repeat protein [Microcoleaceae cyanobacterium]